MYFYKLQLLVLLLALFRGLWGFILDWAPWKRRHKSRRIGYVIEIANE